MCKSEAWRNGYLAYDNSRADANPYNRLTQPYSYSEWDKGFCRKYDEIKHQLPSEYLDDE